MATEHKFKSRPVEGRGEKKPSGQAPERKLTRKTRVPLHGYRDVFNVEPKDPSLTEKYFHYWFYDHNETGRRIHAALKAGYEFCPPADYIIGQDMVYQTAQMDGSVIRMKESEGALYYMRIPMEWHLEDVAAKARIVDETEEQMTKGGDRDDGDYGGVQLDTSLDREVFSK